MNGSPRSAIICAIGAMLVPPTLMSRTAISKSAFRANGSAALIVPASATTRCPSSSSISTVIIRSSISSSTKKNAALLTWLPNRSARVQKLRHRGDKLGGRKRLLKQDTVGYTVRWPVTDGSTRHVDYRECRIDLSGGFSDLPAIHQTLEVYVCDECSVIRDLALE